MADVGIEYGIALYELAKENNKVEKIYTDLIEVKEVLNSNRDYLLLLSSPAINLDSRYECIEKAFSAFDTNILSFLKTLCKNNDVDELFDAIYHYETLYNEGKSIIHANVITSIPLDENEKEKIQTMLNERQNSNVIVNYSIDKDIIGGIVIDIDGETLDGSIKRQLRDIKKVMS